MDRFRFLMVFLLVYALAGICLALADSAEAPVVDRITHCRTVPAAGIEAMVVYDTTYCRQYVAGKLVRVWSFKTYREYGA